MEFYGTPVNETNAGFGVALIKAKDNKKSLVIGNSIKMHYGLAGQLIPQESLSLQVVPEEPSKTEEVKEEKEEIQKD